MIINYRCDNRRFWLSAHNCQVPTPTSQNLATRTANSDLWSRLTHQLLWRLKSTISSLEIYSSNQANSEKLGLGIDNPCVIVFFWVCGCTSAWRGLMAGIFGILESSATQWYQDVTPTQDFVFIVTSTVYGDDRDILKEEVQSYPMAQSSLLSSTISFSSAHLQSMGMNDLKPKKRLTERARFKPAWPGDSRATDPAIHKASASDTSTLDFESATSNGDFPF